MIIILWVLTALMFYATSLSPSLSVASLTGVIVGITLCLTSVRIGRLR